MFGNVGATKARTAETIQSVRADCSSPSQRIGTSSGDGGVPNFVIVCDDEQRRRDLAATFRAAGNVACVDPTRACLPPDRPVSLVVDIDLKSGDSIVRLRRFIADNQHVIQDRLIIAGEGDRRDETQAVSLGATEVLPRGASPRSILRAMRRRMSDDFKNRLALSDANPMTVGLQAAHEVLETIFEGVPVGVLPKRAEVDHASDLVVEAIRDDGISAWLGAVRDHHSSSYRHSLIVTGTMTQFAQRLGMSRRDQQRLARTGLVHDVGKAMIPLDVLDKPGKLSLQDVQQIEAHPGHGYDLLAKTGAFSSEILDGVLHHHEMLDGSGYPDGLAGGQIRDVVRILTICDIYSALIEARAYKPAYEPAQALAIMGTMSGRLDPDLLRAFQQSVVP